MDANDKVTLEYFVAVLETDTINKIREDLEKRCNEFKGLDTFKENLELVNEILTIRYESENDL